jgi:hypothetical protein
VIQAAFWDTSAILPLCAETQPSPRADELYQQYKMVVWWGTPVEIHSALARLQRTGELSPAGIAKSLELLDDLESKWDEIKPSPSLRDLAKEFPSRFGLRAADSLQLAAACIWTMHRPADRPFLSGDQKLLDAARQMGFRAVTV